MREHGLVFWKRLFGDEGAGQIQLAARPGPGTGTEAAHVVEHALNLGLGQHLAEGGHPAVEGPDRTASLNDCGPVGVGLRAWRSRNR